MTYWIWTEESDINTKFSNAFEDEPTCKPDRTCCAANECSQVDDEEINTEFSQA